MPASTIELLAINPPSRADRDATVESETLASPSAAAARRGARRQSEGDFRDLLSKRVQVVRNRCRLSAREAEVPELVARGNTVARIAEELVVSENTIRTHMRRLYAKLDIHKKQELPDLLESVKASEIREL